MADTGARAGALLRIDLAAIRANYRRLVQELGGVPCAAAVKADAYGLGMARVAPALRAAGARHFFVALPDEALALRATLGPEAEIYLLAGAMPGTEADLLAHDVAPVLNSLGDLERWRGLARREGRRLAAALHIDTGMSRLGLPEDELAALADDHGLLDGVDCRYVMSHLACAEDAGHALNQAQLDAFRAARRRLPDLPASLANSSGIFLGAAYHFDLGRPGAALYGVNPTPGRPNPMASVAHLQARILQVRDVDAPQSVGYGATYRVTGPSRLATVGLGYADGIFRSLSNRGTGFIGGIKVPAVGRVSMDLVVFDVSAVPSEAVRPGAMVTLLDDTHGVDALAEEAGTIGYEILTALGRRYHRTYTDS